MNIAILMITDGRRDYLSKSLSSFGHILGQVTEKVIVDDSGNLSYADWIDSRFSDFKRIHHTKRLGFCEAIQSGWANISKDVDYIFHLEDDFMFQRDIYLPDMAMVLNRHPELIQMALRRQAVAPSEIAAGGVIECWPLEFIQKEEAGCSWLEHKLFFTTNPSLYRRSLIERGWPDSPRCEEVFYQNIIKDPEAKFGYWGLREDLPWIHHIGDERVGSGY